MKTKFYQFRQNNSRGHFDVDEDLCQMLLIEATNSKQANRIAKYLGVYFNGCDIGIDCNCCGDRWSKAYDFHIVDLKKLSKWYKTKLLTIEDYAQKFADEYGLTTPVARVFYLSGKRTEINEKIIY